jgi:hypothetical protein
MIVLIETELNKTKMRERCHKCNVLMTKRHQQCSYCKNYLECKKDACNKCDDYFKEKMAKQICLIEDDP